ncbi:unnamed protein product [Boreogadus saida]
MWNGSDGARGRGRADALGEVQKDERYRDWFAVESPMNCCILIPGTASETLTNVFNVTHLTFEPMVRHGKTAV